MSKTANFMDKISIAICADDYAQHEGIDQAVCTLLAKRRLSAVSCMSNAPRWQTSAARLTEFKEVVDFGLHFNLTESFGSPAPTSSLSGLIARAYLSRLNPSTLTLQLQQQCDAFEQCIKQAPAFIDGHQHVHQLPVIREVMQKVLIQRYGHNLPWVRNTIPHSIQYGIKALTLKLLGGAKLNAQLKRAKIASNKGFSGVYDFNTTDYGALFETWLQRIRNRGLPGNLIMCHPAHDYPASDKIGSARQAEYAFFNSETFPQLLQQYQIHVQRLSDILPNAHF